MEEVTIHGFDSKRQSTVNIEMKDQMIVCVRAYGSEEEGKGG